MREDKILADLTSKKLGLGGQGTNFFDVAKAAGGIDPKFALVPPITDKHDHLAVLTLGWKTAR